MYGYWDDLWNHGDGPPLMTDGLPTAREVGGPPMLRSALTASWLPEGVREVLQGLLQSVQGLLGEAEADAEPPRVHPAGISRNWSMLYVWLQYVQWYKVLCWLLIMVIGGSDGLLPAVARDAFRIEELLLTSDARAQLFIFGQCCPFVLSKLRHFLVTWTGSVWLVTPPTAHRPPPTAHRPPPTAHRPLPSAPRPPAHRAAPRRTARKAGGGACAAASSSTHNGRTPSGCRCSSSSTRSSPRTSRWPSRSRPTPP